jgi:hypothetical protein
VPSQTLTRHSAPPLIEQINNGNWLTQQEAEALRDELFYQRAIHAYMTMQPAMNVIGMRDGSEKAFGAGYNVLPYKLHLPPNAPAGLFWAVTAYNITDGTMPETDHLLPSTNGYYDLPKNQDGSIDIWFGPKKPDGVTDAAFIQTIPGRHFLVALRLYGTGVEFFDQTWKPDDVVKVK